jgi:hypothetical protein
VTFIGGRSTVQHGGLLVAACLLGVVLSEGVYRVYLDVSAWFDAPQRPGPIGVKNRSLWEFDEEFGYVYPPGRTVDGTVVKDGHVVNCQRVDVINRDGNVGPIVGRYDTAELKVLVFGDSWAAFQHEGKTWPSFLQGALERRLRKTVHVVNFGRDGYGILQMFDLAAVKVAEWKPDLVLITFISDDLTRARFWRTAIGEGDEVRVLTTLAPVRRPDLAHAADAFLLLPSATYEWCRSMIGAQQADAILDTLIAKRDRLLAGRTPPGARHVVTPHSLLYSRLVHGDPFRFVSRRMPPSVNPRMGLRSFASDDRFMRAVERLRSTGIPWVMFHLAYYPEIKQRREAILGPQEAALWESLEQVMGQSVLRTTDYVELPVPAPERLNASAEDFHPSLWGMEFYANAVADALVKERLARP